MINFLIILVIILFFFILITPHDNLWGMMVLGEIILVGLLILNYTK